MTAEELAARVREDVDRNGDLILKRDDARRGQDMTVDQIMTGPSSMSAEAQQRAAEIAAAPRRELPVKPLRPSSWKKVDVANSPTESILGKAHRLVQGRRGAEYGHPLDNHGATAEMFRAYLQRKYDVRVPMDAEDVCWFNIFQKGSRDANEPGEDNLVDTAGYAFNLELIRAERARRSTPQKPL